MRLKPLLLYLWRLFYRRVPPNAALWAIVQVVTGYLAHRIPAHVLERDNPITAERSIERDGRLYEQTLRIKRWKHKLPEAGAAFAGGFDKGALRAGRKRDPDYLRTYIRETRRAELGHWLALTPTPLFVRHNPWLIAVCMPIYALAVNGPCIAAQRYNRIRLKRVLSRLEGPDRSEPPASAAP